MENHFNCIYCFTNKINGKKYIGQTTNLNRRISEHKSRSGKDNLPFHNAINKYGFDNFEIEILIEDIYLQEELDEYEKSFIKKFNTVNKKFGYNIAEGGAIGNPYKYMSEEQINICKEKQSKKMHEVWNNKTEKEKQEIIKKISDSNKGKIISEETREKISKTLKKKYENGDIVPHNKGKGKGKIPYINKKEHEIIRYNEKTKQYTLYKMSSLAEKDGFDQSSIRKCCKGERQSHGGYKWFYLSNFIIFLMEDEVV